MKAIWNGEVIAESEETIVVEGNHYFPPSSLNKSFFKPSAASKQTICPWKGTADYYDLHVNGQVNADAAWYYPSTSDLAKNIESYVAFWKGVQVTS